MYDYIQGVLVQKLPDRAILDIQGVGYKLRITATTYQALPGLKTTVKLYTYLHVREDILELFGFYTEQERGVFHELLNVSKIGPKAASNILSGGLPRDLQRMILAEDEQSLSTLPGVGKATARRLIAELKTKFEKMDFSTGGEFATATAGLSSVENEAVLALVALGYSRTVAHSMIARLKLNSADALSAQDIIKKALHYDKR